MYMHVHNYLAYTIIIKGAIASLVLPWQEGGDCFKAKTYSSSKGKGRPTSYSYSYSATEEDMLYLLHCIIWGLNKSTYTYLLQVLVKTGFCDFHNTPDCSFRENYWELRSQTGWIESSKGGVSTSIRVCSFISLRKASISIGKFDRFILATEF